ncbi:hypothetical protein CLIB1444_02S08240 [[Candida] jaroonii]|uniref:Uncharacterized protein n=1 Tax=[Candida] jaroonii TaxID=467808 RepID=A0ACA9Y382_9ASCO|nr:hypothetical protein CLIB1444_02S08240 [[Candida] jaroonii]
MKLEININDDLPSLIKLNKLQAIENSSSTTRMVNRCWRLNQTYNKKIFKDGDYFKDLNDDFKPPLISNDTSNTLLSKVSKLSLYTPSDDDEYYKKKSMRTKLNTIEDNEDDKKIFYIDNTPSPEYKNSNNSQSDLTFSKVEKPGMKRQDSLFSNFNLQRSLKQDLYINEENESESEIDESESEIDESEIDESEIDESEIDESEIDESEDVSEIDESEVDEVKDTLSPMNNSSSLHSRQFSNHRSRANSQLTNSQINSQIGSQVNSTTNSTSKKMNQSISSIRRSDDSEWLSVSSEEEEEVQPINFSKRGTSDLSSSQPRSLLSGLFLNEMKGHITSQMRSHRSENDGGDDNDKPQLKRSSTTGIITLGEKNDKIKIQRPSIMFQKKITSMTDIKPLIEGKEIDFQCDDCHNDDKDWKPTSIVGISDFNASFKNHETSNVSESLNKYQTKSLLSLPSFFSKRSASSERFKIERTPSGERTPKISRPSSTIPEPSFLPTQIDNPSTEEFDVPKLITRDTKNIDLKTKEFSKSLKDSLNIDNKLGKVPLSNKILPNNNVNFIIEDDVDDYHSKGW